MLALIPAFLASNWSYAYQFKINSIYFDPSTRALNDLLYCAMQVIGSMMIGYLLDYIGMGRRTQGLVALSALFLLLNAIWAARFAFQMTFDNNYQ
jgi:predicted MFS family arabinose efflux permease